MKQIHSRAALVCEHLSRSIAALCAVFMLCVVPLLFHDAFFDINRIKVNAVIAVIPVFGLIWCLCILLGIEDKRRLPSGIPLVLCCLTAFAAACVVSCALSGFAPHTLTGEKGRYCGLYFIAACSAAFLMIGTGHTMSNRVPAAVIFCGALCAALGVLNAIGIDPLNFYANIRKGQEQVFLSTIGHFDFFGTFLILIFSLAGGYAVFFQGKAASCLSLAASFVMALGMSASRTDSAFLGMHLVCLSLFALSGSSFHLMSRALTLWAGAMLSLPLIHILLPISPYGAELSGLPLFLCESGLAAVTGGLMLIAALVLYLLNRRGVPAPGKKRIMRLGFGLMTAGIVGVLLLIAYFTWINPDAKIGSAAFMLRFNDHWGSLRGFVYIRSLRAYSDFTLTEKLFGKGMETTLSTLTPYFDNPDMLRYGVFNDTHCQPLQLLLTCGVFGAITFVSLYLSLLIVIGKHMKEDPLLCGAFCALIGYLIILAINVTQPILISTYFALSAAALCRIRMNSRKGGNPCES